jgi:hypothetical protein
MPNDAITPFILAVPQADLQDLNRRIDQTHWPDAETVDDWTQGAPLAKVKALIDHWRRRYDWCRCKAMLNDRCQYKTSIARSTRTRCRCSSPTAGPVQDLAEP